MRIGIRAHIVDRRYVEELVAEAGLEPQTTPSA